MSARASDVSSAVATVSASARKKVPVTPVIEINGRNTTIGVMVEPTSVALESPAVWLLNGLAAALARIAVQHDVFHHHDRVVDHQPHSRGQAAQRHQIEAFSQRFEGD